MFVVNMFANPQAFLPASLLTCLPVCLPLCLPAGIQALEC
ncbi:hypothetical protein M125_5479 [Bacteroides fragilis str. 3998T(B)3]|uniref:Uncharacterized protein n=1 Tax=Bacteroides fragilis str. 3998T(B)3 TaxID=1339316 RepID=A0A015UXZ2_BACFG|nr:hypothetical protein M117_4678 [Bacteroides fragilis str. 3774 T13]EXY87896.1 hypothetical protein M125_5479 [Bacteroides fragilis str. 3998T(B)3]